MCVPVRCPCDQNLQSEARDYCVLLADDATVVSPLLSGS
jgi:hypothetical protein